MPLSKQVSVITKEISYQDGVAVLLTELRNKDITIEVTNFGCTITSIFTSDKNGIQKNIVAGFPDVADYKNNEHYIGCIIGRYANRIAGGKFSLDGITFQLPLNDGTNHLHGGSEGFHKQVWTLSSIIENETEVGVIFEYESKDGEEGYPGNLSVTIKYLLNTNNQLLIYYSASTDKSTPVNLTNHTYFNLTGFETPEIYDHLLQINAESYTVKNKNNIPDGTIQNVSGTALDFLQPKPIGQHIDQLVMDMGYDHNFILNDYDPGKLVLAAELSELQTGRMVSVFTDKPAVQLYSGNYWDGNIIGRQGFPYVKHGGVALETQSFPDSPNQPHFPNTILHPGELYNHHTVYAFSVK